MSELDGISPREMEAFKREYVDSHTEIKVLSALNSLHKGSYKNGSLSKMEPGDKNAERYQVLKKPIERECMEVQREKAVNCLFEAFDIRKKEILNKKDFSMKDLLGAMAKLMPQKSESKVETTHNFAEEIKRLTLEKKTYKAIDAEDAS